MVVKRLGRTFISILIFGLLLGGYSFFESYLIQEKITTITDQNLPDAFDGKKIVFISDVQHCPFFSIKKIENLVNRINNLNPDIVILIGDNICKDREFITFCFEKLGKLKAKLGVYGITGYNPYTKGYKLIKQSMERAGIILLDNKAECIESLGEKIKIRGVFNICEGAPDINEIIKDVRKDDFLILVSHNLYYSKHLNTEKINLILAGYITRKPFARRCRSILSLYNRYKRVKDLFEMENRKIVIASSALSKKFFTRLFIRSLINIIILKTV
ncbi:metallophosphoesterase [bacterium]